MAYTLHGRGLGLARVPFRTGPACQRRPGLPARGGVLYLAGPVVQNLNLGRESGVKRDRGQGVWAAEGQEVCRGGMEILAHDFR